MTSENGGIDVRSDCVSRANARARELAAWESHAARVGSARLLVAAGVVGLVAAVVWAPLPPAAWWGVALLGACFVALVILHARIYESKERALSAVQFYRLAIAGLDGKWFDGRPPAESSRDGGHRYAGDLDIFGPASLFHRLDWTSTRLGEMRLRGFLAGEGLGEWPSDVRDRQVAVRELASQTEFRERLFVEGAALRAARPDPLPLLEWAEGVAFEGTVLVRIARWVLPPVAVFLLLFASVIHVPPLSFLLPMALGILISLPNRAAIATILDAVQSHERSLARYAALVSAIESQTFTAPRLRALQERLRGADNRGATRLIRALATITSWIDARNNEVFRLFIGPLLMWDVHAAFVLERWKRRAGVQIRTWLEVVGDVEALASLASFAFEESAAVYPELAPTPAFDAKGIGHPLIDSKRRVGNDVELEGPGSTLVVTGSNMSGKSTLLRAVGVNAVLALAGAPVCASSLRIGPLSVATSMRMADSLADGVSHFYAELQKLKMILDCADRAPTVLYLFDEILHGTNSRERLIGAREVIRQLVQKGALGAVSTHDIALGDLEAALPEVVRNVHFEEQVEGGVMTFDYRLRQGVVTSSNALRLMHSMGIIVGEENGATPSAESLD